MLPITTLNYYFFTRNWNFLIFSSWQKLHAYIFIHKINFNASLLPDYFFFRKMWKKSFFLALGPRVTFNFKNCKSTYFYLSQYFFYNYFFKVNCNSFMRFYNYNFTIINILPDVNLFALKFFPFFFSLRLFFNFFFFFTSKNFKFIFTYFKTNNFAPSLTLKFRNLRSSGPTNLLTFNFLLL